MSKDMKYQGQVEGKNLVSTTKWLPSHLNMKKEARGSDCVDDIWKIEGILL